MKNQNAILQFNNHEYFTEIKKIKEAHPQIQQCIDEFLGLNLFPLDNISQLKKLMFHGVKYIKEQLEEIVKAENPSIGKFKLKTGPIVDQMELPDLTAIDNLCFVLKKYEYLVERSFIYKYGKLTINEEAIENLKENYCLKARTPAQNSLYEKHSTAAKAMNELEKAMIEARGAGIFMEFEFNKMFYKDPSGEIIIRPTYYGTIWNDLQKFAGENK